MTHKFNSSSLREAEMPRSAQWLQSGCAPVFRNQVICFVSQVSHCSHLSSSTIFVTSSRYLLQIAVLDTFNIHRNCLVSCLCSVRNRPSNAPKPSPGLELQGDKAEETPPMPSIQNDKRHWSTLSPPSEDGTCYSPTILDTPYVDTTTVANWEDE